MQTTQTGTGRGVAWSGWVAVVAIVIALSASGFAQQPPSDGFVPVDQLAVQEQLPAAPLVMAAYAIAWLAVFGYLWSIWQRLGRVEREIADVARRVEAGARR